MELTKAEAHLNGPLFLNAIQSLEEAAKIINCDPNVLERLKRPRRCLTVAVPVRMDDYTVKVFTGYRVQYNATLGPYKRGNPLPPKCGSSRGSRACCIDDL